MSDFQVHAAPWLQYRDQLSTLRRLVFIEELAIPAHLEWEEQDARCTYFLALTGHDKAIGCVRITPQAQIGRLAVLPQWRRRGVGSALTRAGINHLQGLGYTELYINAQHSAIEFYLRLGFSLVGDEFFEAGIAHRKMRIRP